MKWIIFMCMAVCASVQYALCATTTGDKPTTTLPLKTEDRAELEQGPGYSTYGHEQMEVAKQRGILPLVDTVREKDKYGNDGGQTRLAGDIFTRIFEDASRSLSKSLGEPDSDTVNLLEGLKPALEDLGDSLAGLA